MLTLVFAEAELELVPESILHHTQVTRAARSRDRRGRWTLLDSSVHHEAMRHIPEAHRRGRPDLVHFGLLLALDSALNEADELRVVVHTRNDELLTVRPDTRLMRNYPRFVGLMEKLFREGATPAHAEEPLLSLQPAWDLRRVLRTYATGPIVCLAEQGTPVEPIGWFAEKAKTSPDLTVVLGCFPHGDFREPPSEWADEVVGLGGRALSVWTAEMEVLAAWEYVTGVFPRANPEEGSPPAPGDDSASLISGDDA